MDVPTIQWRDPSPGWRAMSLPHQRGIVETESTRMRRAMRRSKELRERGARVHAGKLRIKDDSAIARIEAPLPE